MRKENAGLSKWELDTPCLCLDIDLLKENIRRMKELADSAGKKLRPHCKTHKCSKIAELQLEAGAEGLCVAKVSEAEKLIEKGITQILITSPVVTEQKIENLFKCLSTAQELAVVVDNADNVKTLNSKALAAGKKLNVFIDVNPGLGRTGVSYGNALEFGRFTSSLEGLSLQGVQCYAGNLQHIKSYSERSERSLSCMRRAAEIFKQLSRETDTVRYLTGTGTGTHDIDIQIKEVTDIQVGSYTVMDTEYMEIGSARDPEKFTDFKPALTLLSSVISVNQPDTVTIDAGLKAVYFTPHAPSRIINPKAGINWLYSWFGDEHGKITIERPEEKPSLADVVELTVSHCDPTINLYDNFYITQNGKVIDCWEIDLRGCCK